MAAMTGASGARSWLQSRHSSWLTPRRMKLATVGIFTAAVLGSSVALSGSSTAHEQQHPQPVHHTAQSR
jgi:Na+/glutamate symporter